jgi:hypothetical protein
LLLSVVISFVSLIALFFLAAKSYDYIVNADSAVDVNWLRAVLMIAPGALVAGALIWLAYKSAKNDRRLYTRSYIFTIVIDVALLIVTLFVSIFFFSGIVC